MQEIYYENGLGFSGLENFSNLIWIKFDIPIIRTLVNSYIIVD
jgi:hypothetical protein